MSADKPNMSADKPNLLICFQHPIGWLFVVGESSRVHNRNLNGITTGFTSGNTTWLPVNDNYLSINVKVQKEAQQSALKVYRDLAALRKEEVFFSGDIAFPLITEEIFSFVRWAEG